MRYSIAPMTNSTPHSAAPLTRSQRIDALDTTRGFAVLGILLMNVWSFSGPQAFFDYPLAAAGMGGAPLETWAFMHTFFEGSQRAVFSMLFGAGMLLMVNRLDESAPNVRPARIYYRRLGFLMLFGLFHLFVLLQPVDILLIYALCGLLLYPLRKLSVPVLLTLALLVFAAHGAIRFAELAEKMELYAEYQAVQDSGLAATADQQARIDAWLKVEQRARPRMDAAEMQESIRIYRSGELGEFLVYKLQTSVILFIVVGLKSLFLDALGAMLVGMALLRAGVLTLTAPPGVYLLLPLVGYAVGLPLSLWETWALISSEFDPLLKARNLLHYDVRRIAMGLGHLGLVLLACRAWPGNWLARKIGAVGRMALTNYLSQTLICAILFYTIGFGLYGTFTGYYLYVLTLAIWTVQIVFSNWWLQSHRFGPCEWLWRSLTYGRRQPNTLDAAAA